MGEVRTNLAYGLFPYPGVSSKIPQQGGHGKDLIYFRKGECTCDEGSARWENLIFEKIFFHGATSYPNKLFFLVSLWNNRKIFITRKPKEFVERLGEKRSGFHRERLSGLPGGIPLERSRPGGLNG